MKSKTEFRPEIQGLRAIAVLAVLLFHLWPDALQGGYIGVDVFFVISGFLITGILFRQVENEGRIDVIGFYIKRIKRLVPAATVVLLSIAVCISLLPITRWHDTANEMAASAFYVQNWWLAAQSVDYLASENLPSPVMHYWSLSIEEQYYVVWPILFGIVAVVLSRSSASVRATFGTVIVLIGVSSLAYSIYLTPRAPGLAYFATTSRAWELALGGSLAVFGAWNRLGSAAKFVCGWVGLAMVITAAVTFDAETAFPGYTALLPTVGAALIIMAGSSGRLASVSRLLSSAPMQYLGDLSYSLYLWHWPVIVFYQSVAGRALGLVDGVAVAGISLALAHQTKYLVEDGFRGKDFIAGRRWQPFAFTALSFSVIVLCWQAIQFQSSRHSNVPPADDSIAASVLGCDGSPDTCLSRVRPSFAEVAKDIPPVYREQGCHTGLSSDEVRLCTLGSSASAHKLFVIGDSHAAQWFPVYEHLASEHGWYVLMTTKSACSFADVVVKGGRSPSGAYESCTIWGKHALEAIRAANPDYVLVAQSVAYSVPGKDRAGSFDGIVEGYQRRLSEVVSVTNAKVLLLADTPRLGINASDCLARPGATVAGCSRPAREVLARPDPLIAAGEEMGVSVIDPNDLVCPDGVCPPVIGGVLVWRDTHHVTATLAASLAPILSERIAKAVE